MENTKTMQNKKTVDNTKTVDVLNRLVTINNDRIEGYKTASEETEEEVFKTLFSQFISNSQTAKQYLVSEVRKLGGKETEGTKTTGKFFRAWMEVKSAFTGNDREAILDSCENGEDKALDTYNDVIKNDVEHLNAHQRNMITVQKQKLKSDRDHIVSMKN